jgi:hypothetical protein
MQQEFLATTPSPEPTLPDVVRFLRQSGDVVVTEGTGYRVNYTLKLTPEQLVARANEQRRRRRMPGFIVRKYDTGSTAVAGTPIDDLERHEAPLRKPVPIGTGKTPGN